MNKAVFLDRDGTLNVEKHYLHRIDEFEYIPGVIEGLKMLQENGYLLIIITNQSGIARGFYSEEDFNILNDWMLADLCKFGVNISKVYYCPHLPNAENEKYSFDCNCRKPRLGLFEKAIEEFDIDIKNSFAIGDKIRDCSICFQTECQGYLVANNEDEEIIGKVKRGEIKNIKYAKTFNICCKEIVEYERNKV